MKSMRIFTTAFCCTFLWCGAALGQDEEPTIILYSDGNYVNIESNVDIESNINIESYVDVENIVDTSFFVAPASTHIAMEEVHDLQHVSEVVTPVASTGKPTCAERRAMRKEARKAKKAEKREQKETKKANKKGISTPVVVAAPPAPTPVEIEIAELKRAQELLFQQQQELQVALEAAQAEASAAVVAATEAARTAQVATAAMTAMQGGTGTRRTATERRSSQPVTTATPPIAPRRDASGLVFRVQIAARTGRLSNPDAEFSRYNLNVKINEELHDNLFKYTVGSFRQIEAAVASCNEIRSRGIPDAFVVAYYRGNRILMTEAYAILGRN